MRLFVTAQRTASIEAIVMLVLAELVTLLSARQSAALVLLGLREREVQRPEHSSERKQCGKTDFHFFPPSPIKAAVFGFP